MDFLTKPTYLFDTPEAKWSYTHKKLRVLALYQPLESFDYKVGLDFLKHLADALHPVVINSLSSVEDLGASLWGWELTGEMLQDAIEDARHWSGLIEVGEQQ